MEQITEANQIQEALKEKKEAQEYHLWCIFNKEELSYPKAVRLTTDTNK